MDVPHVSIDNFCFTTLYPSNYQGPEPQGTAVGTTTGPGGITLILPSGATWVEFCYQVSNSFTAGLSWAPTDPGINLANLPEVQIPGTFDSTQSTHSTQVIYGWVLPPAGPDTQAVDLTATSSDDPSIQTKLHVIIPAHQLSAVRPGPSVSLGPTLVVVPPGRSRTFTASTLGLASAGVTWSLPDSDSGTLSNLGATSVTYNLPSQGSGPWHLLATSVADPTVSSQVTILPASYSLTSLANLADAFGGNSPIFDLDGDGTVDDPDVTIATAGLEGS